MVTLKSCVNMKVGENSTVEVDVIIEADTAREATDALKDAMKDLEASS